MRKLFASILISSFFLIVSVASAAEFDADEEIFDKDIEYKIFFSGDQEYTNAIENVRILGFKEIAGRLFLVVHSKGFSISRDLGYVLFDSISAILPDQDLRVHRVKKVHH